MLVFIMGPRRIMWILTVSTLAISCASSGIGGESPIGCLKSRSRMPQRVLLLPLQLLLLQPRFGFGHSTSIENRSTTAHSLRCTTHKIGDRVGKNIRLSAAVNSTCGQRGRGLVTTVELMATYPQLTCLSNRSSRSQRRIQLRSHT